VGCNILPFHSLWLVISYLPFLVVQLVIIGSCAWQLPSISALNARPVAQTAEEFLTTSNGNIGYPVSGCASHQFTSGPFRKASRASIRARDIPRRFVRACFVAGAKALQGDPDHPSMVHVILNDSKNYICSFASLTLRRADRDHVQPLSILSWHSFSSIPQTPCHSNLPLRAVPLPQGKSCSP